MFLEGDAFKAVIGICCDLFKNIVAQSRLRDF
ncbi:hypothetical protein GGQ73_000118 [Rhizobium skierniewicense]|uniref:Uncharacterized protein n=1 Tax=Rhizobium skierniewicense TaxID=984260 RepID=A0A7W6G014_9HYPH|nr:hypothetical protein [Rhizobium skierniewicense]